VALAFSQAVFNQRLHPVWRLVLSGLVMATFYVSIVVRFWTSGWLPPLVAVVVILGAAAPRLGLVTILGLGSMVALKAHEIINNFVVVGDNTRFTLTARLEAYRIVSEIARVSPILGLGPANYYWYTPLFSLLGWHVKFNSHSQYVDLMAQTGLLGLACFFWFAWEVGRLGWQLRTQVPSGFVQAYVYGALGGLAGMLVAGILGDWVLPFVYNVGVVGLRSSMLGWLFLGALVFLEHRFGPAYKRTIDEEA